MKYKKLTLLELKAIANQVRMFAQHIKEPCVALMIHIKAQELEIEALKAEIDNLHNPSLLGVTKTTQSDVGSPFTDNKKLFKSYYESLTPGSLEYERVRRWSRPPPIKNETTD